MLLKIPFLSAVPVMLYSASTAVSIPPSLSISHPTTLVNTTNVSQDLTFSPWPARPFEVPLHARFSIPNLVIFAVFPFHAPSLVSVPALQDFLQDFGTNLQREYPVPGYLPRLARQSFHDMASYTKWTLNFEEGLWGYRMLTEWALLALIEMAKLLGRHGPARFFFSITEGFRTYRSGALTIDEFSGLFVNSSLANGTSSFRTI